MGLIDVLPAGRVALDTSIFIYLIERNPAYERLLLPLFAELDAGRREAVTSALTLLEVLVVPYRAGDVAVAEQYELLLTRGRGLQLVDIDRAQLRTAAQLRALHGLRTPDALQIASALSRDCSAFVTNDRRLQSVQAIPVIVLYDLLGG